VAIAGLTAMGIGFACASGQAFRRFDLSLRRVLRLCQIVGAEDAGAVVGTGAPGRPPFW
jgi:hypothetical protein